MFYIISREWAGPNVDDHLDFDQIEITTEPPRWCGTANDVCVLAHGQYETIEAAREAIDRIWDDGVREISLREAEADDDVVEAYRPGLFADIDLEATENWLPKGLLMSEGRIRSDSTDEELAAYLEEIEEDINDREGCSVRLYGMDVLRAARDAMAG